MNENDKFHRYVINYDAKGKNIPLNMPKFCPICMSPEIAGILKLRDSTSNRKFVSIPLCLQHYNFYRNHIFKVFWIIILCIILNSLVYIFTGNITFFLILNVIILLFFFFYFLRSSISRIMKHKNIRDYIDVKYKNKVITILIRKSDWAIAFTKLNNYEYYELIERNYKDLIENLNPKITKLFIIFLIFIIFNIIIRIISDFVFKVVWLDDLLIDGILIIGLIILGSFFLFFLHLKDKYKKEQLNYKKEV